MALIISLQEAREQIAKNSGALLATDREFFDTVQNRFDGLKAKASHPADFRRLSNDVSSWIQKYTAKASWDDAKDRPVYDGAMGWVAVIDREIENRVLAGEVLENASSSSSGSGWRNAKTGEAVKLYAPDEPMASSSAHNNVDIGELLEGFLFGAKTEAVRNALSSGTDSAGGYTVPLEISRDYIDKLRAETVVIRAGARTLKLDGPTRIVRLAGDPSPVWREENASIGDSDLSLDAITLDPKSLSTLVKVPYELLMDSVNLGDILKRALVSALATKLDYGCLFGSGTSPEIQGLFGTSGINSISLGTNGGVPTYDTLTDMLYELELDNSAPPTAAIWHPRTARTFRKIKDGQGNAIAAHPDVVNIPKLATTSVPINQTQGTSNVASTILMGDFTQVIIGMREDLQIIPLKETFALNGQIGFWARMRVDVGFAHPESFCKAIGVTAA